MYRLFSKPLAYRGAMVSSKFIQAKFKYEESLNIATEFYNQNSAYLNNNHILIRLVSGLVFDPNAPAIDVYRQIEANSNRISSGLGITTDINPGNMFKKAFYTHNCAIVNVSFSEALKIPHWTHIRAVRPLTHPHVTLQLVLPHRLKSLDETDYSVVGIDLPLLAVQFKGWFLEQMKRPVTERESIAQFVYMWVLPGMLPEQIDIALRNRMQYMCLGIKREEPDLRPPIFIQDYDREFDRAIEGLVEFYNKGERAMTEVMLGMPMMHADNYFHAVPKNLNSLSIHSYWIRLMVYTDWIYPVAVGFDVDPLQENITRKLMVVRRYVDGTRAWRFLEGPIRDLCEERYEAIMAVWT
jgi:hypothetical protein